MMDHASEATLALVNPLLAQKVRTLADMMELAGHPIKAVQGVRSWNQQQVLWQLGRDDEGKVVDESIVVTHAPPGHSWHQFGMAVDCVPEQFLPFKNWCPNSTIWDDMGRKGESLGLEWGGRWPEKKKDLPHFQLPGKFPTSPDDEVRQIFIAGGMETVWEEAGIHARA